MFGQDLMDEDESSEATMLFKTKMNPLFRRAFPLRSEKAQRLNPAGTMSNTFKRQLDFDQSLASPEIPSATPSNLSSKIRVKELEEDLAKVQRKCKHLEEDLMRQTSINETLEKEATTMRATLQTTRQEVNSTRGAVEQRSLKMALDEMSRDMKDWRSVAGKYHLWFHTMRDQLRATRGILRTHQLWTTANKSLIRDASRMMLEQLENNDLETSLSVLEHELASNFEWVLELEPSENDDDEVADRTDVALDTGTQHTEFARSGTPPSQETSAIWDTSAANESSLLNSALMNSSIVVEKDEKIETLKYEKNELSQQLAIANARAQQCLLLQEQKRSHEESIKFLEGKLESVTKELISLRAASARGLFDISTDVAAQSRTLQSVDKITHLQSEINSKDDTIKALTEDVCGLHKRIELLTHDNSDLEDTVASKTSQMVNLERELKTTQDELINVRNQLEDIRNRMLVEDRKAAERIDELETELSETKQEMEEMDTFKLSSSEVPCSSSAAAPTDAGDTTQILHIASNPLHNAHMELQEQNRKRMLNDDIGPDAKRGKDEDIEELKQKLEKSEKEKDRAVRTQNDMAMKYREIVTALTGWQVRVKSLDEGLCYISSVYDDTNNNFVLKYYYDSERVDLLDVEQTTASQQAQRPWQDEMRKYLGERGSVPAFLASVTLRLEDMKDVEYTDRIHTFSILPET